MDFFYPETRVGNIKKSFRERYSDCSHVYALRTEVQFHRKYDDEPTRSLVSFELFVNKAPCTDNTFFQRFKVRSFSLVFVFSAKYQKNCQFDSTNGLSALCIACRKMASILCCARDTKNGHNLQICM